MKFLTITFLFTVQLLFGQGATNLSYKQLDSLLEQYSYEGDFERMLDYAKIAFEKSAAEKGEKDTISASYIRYMGFGYEMLGNYDLAYESYEKNKTIVADILGTRHYKYAEALANLAAYYWTVENYDKAEPLYLEAQIICRKSIGTNNEYYATIQNDLGLLYHNMGKYEEAELLYRSIIAYDKKTLGEKHVNYGFSLNNLASLYWATKEFAKAEPLFLQAREIWKNALGSEHPQYAVVTNNLANLYMLKEKYLEAEELYEELVEVDKKTLGEEHPSYALSMSNLAMCYKNLKKYKKAEKTYMEVSKIYQKVYGVSHSKNIMLNNNIGVLYKEMRDLKKAKEYFDKAMELVKTGDGDVTYSGLTYSNLAKFNAYQGKLDTAMVYGIASFLYSRKDGQKIWSVFPEKAENFELNADLVKFCSELTEDHWKELAAIEYKHITYPSEGVDYILIASKNKYQKLLELGDEKQAKRYILNSYLLAQTAIKINEHFLKDLSEKSDKLGAIRENMSFSKFGISAAIKLESEDYLKTAFSFAEKNKSILLSEAFKGEKARQFGDLPDSLAQKMAAFKAEKDLVEKQKHEATSQEDVAALRAIENELNLDIEDLLNKIKKDYPKYHAIKYENIIATVDEVQSLLDDKSMMLEYLIADSTTYLMAITKKSIKVLPLPIDKVTLNKKIKDLRMALTNYQAIVNDEEKAFNSYNKPAYWFYQKLVEPALKQSEIKRLIIVADGELGHLPFEVFLVESSQKKKVFGDLHYLVNDYTISYNYSATLWKENLKTEKKVNNNKLLACAASYPPLDSSYLEKRGVVDFDIRNRLGTLPAAEEELDGLAKSFVGTFLKGQETNESFFKEHAKEYGVIHLAMHGILHPRVPILSSLAFTEDGDSVENNFLQAYEIAHLKLNADLVVLSACETGFGMFEQGEGVMSLARSFMYSGTRSLVVSLWQVNDHCTSIIMQSFYKKLGGGMAIDEALRQAKLDFIKETTGPAAHPAFWSPFIQLGDHRPVHLAQKGSTNYFYIGGGGLLFFLFLIVIRIVLGQKRNR